MPGLVEGLLIASVPAAITGIIAYIVAVRQTKSSLKEAQQNYAVAQQVRGDALAKELAEERKDRDTIIDAKVKDAVAEKDKELKQALEDVENLNDEVNKLLMECDKRSRTITSLRSQFVITEDMLEGKFKEQEAGWADACDKAYKQGLEEGREELRERLEAAEKKIQNLKNLLAGKESAHEKSLDVLECIAIKAKPSEPKKETLVLPGFPTKREPEKKETLVLPGFPTKKKPE